MACHWPTPQAPELPPSSPEFSLCGTCDQLDGSAINALLNYILNIGVVGGCGKLCHALNNTVARDVCDVACDYVGIQAFVKAIEKANRNCSL